MLGVVTAPEHSFGLACIEVHPDRQGDETENEIAAVVCVAVNSPAHATLLQFSATLSGSQEIPPNGSPGTGTASLTADKVADTLSYSVSFANLESPSTVAHIHFGAPGVAGPVIIPLTGFPVGVTSGSYSALFTAADLINGAMTGITTFPQLLASLEAGSDYTNIHTQLFPAGEIRGQIEPARVPEPATFTVLGLAIGALVATRRRI